jgi:hypothetical protein
MRARVSQVRSEYERLSEELRPKWKAAVEREWRRLDGLQRRRARELGAGFERTQELQACWRYLHTLDTNPADAERRLRKATAPVSAVRVDLSGVLEAIEDASADTVIERVSREWSERMIASEAVNRASEEAVEQARQEREIEHARVRREAFS